MPLEPPIVPRVVRIQVVEHDMDGPVRRIGGDDPVHEFEEFHLAAALLVRHAIAHKIWIAAYHMLTRGVGYRELGEAYLDLIDQTRTVADLKRRLERLGYVVSATDRARRRLVRPQLR
jgi:hypothetical protein